MAIGGGRVRTGLTLFTLSGQFFRINCNWSARLGAKAVAWAGGGVWIERWGGFVRAVGAGLSEIARRTCRDGRVFDGSRLHFGGAVLRFAVRGSKDCGVTTRVARAGGDEPG